MQQDDIIPKRPPRISVPVTSEEKAELEAEARQEGRSVGNHVAILARRQRAAEAREAERRGEERR